MAESKPTAWFLEGESSFEPKSPSQAAKPGMDKRAHLEVVKPAGINLAIPLCFNPTEYQLSKQNTFQEVPIPGTGAPPIQFVRGASEKLTFEAVVDTSDDMTNVRKRYVDPLRKLMAIDGGIHAPPVVKFKWESFEFVGVIESLTVTFTLFDDAGVPVRAKLAFTLKEYTTIADQKALAKKESPDLEKTYVVKRGDTLTGIAESAYGDPSEWRAIATANSISDPRMVRAGMVITIPRLGGTA